MGAERFKDTAREEYHVDLTLAEAESHIKKFFRLYPTLRRWQNEQGNGGGETRTLAGRRRLQVDKYTERLNTPIQGTAADGLKKALALLWERRGEVTGAKPVIVAHDEVVFEADEAQAFAVSAWMDKALKDGMGEFIAPVEVVLETQIGRTWAG